MCAEMNTVKGSSSLSLSRFYHSATYLIFTQKRAHTDTQDCVCVCLPLQISAVFSVSVPLCLAGQGIIATWRTGRDCGNPV